MAKQKKISAMTSKKRLVFFFSVIIIMFVVLALRLGQIQIIKADDYSSQALRQQTRDVPITAKRGNIYDTNNKPLAINQSMSTVWVRPSEVKAAEKEKSGYAREMASVLSDILGDMTEDEVYEIITGDTSLQKLKKYVDDEKVAKIREEMAKGGDESRITGLQIAETVKRYYPMGAFASHVIGSTNDDNNGMSGIALLRSVSQRNRRTMDQKRRRFRTESDQRRGKVLSGGKRIQYRDDYRRGYSALCGKRTGAGYSRYRCRQGHGDCHGSEDRVYSRDGFLS